MSEPTRENEPLPVPGFVAWRWIALGAVVCIPFAVALPLGFLKKRALHLALFDPLIWGLALWLAGGLLLRDRSRLRLHAAQWLRCVWPAAVWIGVSLLSLATASDLDRKALLLVAKTLFQHTEYVLVTPFVLLALLQAGPWRFRAAVALLLGTGATAAWALAQTGGDTPSFFISGPLANRNALGITLALAIPLAAGGLAQARGRRRGVIVMILALLVAGVAVMTLSAAWALAALAFGLTTALAGRHPAWAVGGVLAVGIALALSIHPDQGRALARSVQVYRLHEDPQTGAREVVVAMRYRRWMANVNMIRKNPVLGVGWGQYSRRLSAYGTGLPTERARTDNPRVYDILVHEPQTFSWWFETAGETGLLGLAALALLLGVVAARLAGEHRSAWASACLGGLFVLLLAGWWTKPVARGAGPLLGLLLAASVVSRDETKEGGD